MKNRLFLAALLVLLSGAFEPSYGQSDAVLTAAEQRLIDDQQALAIPEDAQFNELLMNDFARMMTSGAPTDDPQLVYPGLRVFAFAIPRSCSGLENFYQQHWPGFEFLVDSSSSSTHYQAFLGWQDDDLYQVQVDSLDDVDDSADGVALMVSDHSPDTANPMSDLTRDLYGIPNDTDWCSVLMVNYRRVDLADIPLSLRGLSSGNVYSSVTGLFNIVAPTADNFFVDRFSISETSAQDRQQFAEEVSFLIGDFGELYRAGVVQLSQQFAPLAEAAEATSTADALARVPLARHFGGELPGDIELITAEKVMTDYGLAVQALYRVEEGSMLMQITGLDPLATSTQSDALVAVMAARVGDFVIFATAQNDYLASEDDESVLIASIDSKARTMMSLLTWSRTLPGDAELPNSVMSPRVRPHLERCARQYYIDGGVAFENTCDQRLAFQILMSPGQEKIVEDVIASGETIRFTDVEQRFTFAACPSGYEADRNFDADNLGSILASQYNCSQRDADLPSTAR